MALTSPITSESVKLRSNGLYFHRFCPQFALFPVVGKGRIDVARGLVIESVVSRVVGVSSSHIKGPDGAIASVHSNTVGIFAKPRAVGTARLFEFHRPKSTSANLERLEDCPTHSPLEQGLRHRETTEFNNDASQKLKRQIKMCHQKELIINCTYL
ncbi:hypothetical protein AVEN_160451-1 [Araneus ventricosus]|uniref:Uncharacterized protein n=1 Tax=Araneus ventricosus TaxID=182803 RepID=A0A4Y2NGZ0_ARAVE|nr:hypothetical protein AVEN_160451-1 [Araneus ventricosus]